MWRSRYRRQGSGRESVGLYENIGGRDTCYQLSAAFYGRVAGHPLLRPLFPGQSHRCAIEMFAAFLAQLLDGPSGDTQDRWWLSLRESHLRFKIGLAERDAWMQTMIAALDDVPLEEPARLAFRDLFERGSAYLVNSGPSLEAVPSRSDHEIAARWEIQRTLDEVVDAIRRADGERAIALAEGLQRNRPVLASLLALMNASGDSAMRDYSRHVLLRDPELVHEHLRHGRTLLHEASGEGDSAAVEFLLCLGADANVTDGGGHTPLYCVGNECGVVGGGSVVRALVRSGADVNARGGAKRCTALHMAARRGNVEVAEALLECGADIEARDRVGDTPLRRAINCKKPAVAALLLRRQQS
jgi:truncated hemoglobin YjbI